MSLKVCSKCGEKFMDMETNDGAASLVRSDTLLALADEWDKKREKLVNAHTKAVFSGLKKGVLPTESHGVGEA